MPKKYQDVPKSGYGGDGEPVPTPTPTGEGNPPTVIEADCGSGRALNSSITTPSNVTASVRNVGECELDVQLFDVNNAKTSNAVVAPGKQGTISGTGITKVDVVCLQTPGGVKCRFSYRIVWT